MVWGPYGFPHLLPNVSKKGGKLVNARKAILMAVIVIVLAAAMVGGATMAWFTDSASSGDVEFTAGTLRIDANTAYFYGVEYKNPENQRGTLYEIFVDDDNDTVSYSKLYDSTRTALNALAYDRKNKRLYYADGNGNLFYYDFNTGQGDKSAGKLFPANTKIFNAAFGLGYYWFVKEGSDDLYKVSFNSNGSIAQVVLAHENFTGNPNRRFGFGDISMDMRDGIIYGSTTGPGSSNRLFFSYNVYTQDYIEYAGNANSLQIAFGANGVLYGTVTRDYDWYRVDTSTGTRTFFYKSDLMFGDLASNHQNNWNPGDCELVNYEFKNIGTKNMVFRFTPSIEWSGNLDLSNIDIELCDNSNDWVRFGDTFYYVGAPLAPGENAALCLKVCLSGPDTDNEYQGATLTLGGEVEAVQSSNNAPYYQWNLGDSGNPTQLQQLYDYLLPQ